MGKRLYVDNGSVGLSADALRALDTGRYGQLSNRKQQYRTSQEQVESIPKLPMLDGMGASFSSDNNWESSFGKNKASIDIDRARRNYAEKYAEELAKQNSNDENYVVKRDRYDKLMKDNRLANDIKLLAEVNYKNANQSADVREEWANEYGAKKITGGYNKKDFIKTLSRRYGLTPEELNDMALTFHSDAYKKETEQWGKDLEKLGQEHSVLGSVGSLVGTLGSGVEGAYNTVVGGITGDDRYLSDIFRTTKNSPRQGVKKNIKTDAGKLAYDVTIGIGDMGVGAAAGSAPVVLAGNTANEAQASARERGSSVRKSSAYGVGAGALDFIFNKIGLEKAKDLAVNSIKSAGLKQFLAKNAVAGAGEGLENVLQDVGQSVVDELINGKNAELNQSYDAKIASGMSESDALKAVAVEYAKQLGTSGAIGFGMGSAMQGAKSVFGKVPEAANQEEAPKIQSSLDKGMPKLPEVTNTNVAVPDSNRIRASLEAGRLPEVVDTTAQPVETPKNYKIDTVNLKGGKKGYYVSELIGDNGSRNAESGKVYRTEAEAQKALSRIQSGQPANVPQENVAPVMEDSIENHPRYKKPLEGMELDKATTQRKFNQDAITRLKNEIGVLEKDPKNMYRGNLKKAIQNEIKAKKTEISKLQAENRGLEKQIKGGITPVKDILTAEQKNNIYDTSGKYDSVFSQINLMAKYAGDTPEAKDLAKQAQASIREYINTGSDDSVREIAMALGELDNLAKTTNAEYVSKKGNKSTYATRFGEQARPLENMKPVTDIYESEKAARKAAQNARPETDVQTDERLSNEEIDEINRRLEEDETRDFETDDSGNVPPNEPPKPPVPPEEPPAPENSLSRRYDTLKKSDLFTKSEENMKMLENAKEKGVFNKDVESRKKSQEEALKEYLADEEGVTQKNFERDWDSGKDVDTAMLVLHDALDSGSQAYTNLALLKQAIQGKKAGRVLRGMRDYAYSGTKEGTLSKVGDYLVDKAEKVLKDKKTGTDYKVMAEKAKKGDVSFIKKLDMDETNANRIKEAIANGASEQDIATMLAMYKAVGTTGVSQEALDEVSKLYKEIEKVPPTSKARADLEADVFKVLAKDVGGKRTWGEQWDAWRYLAMLGNPKTHLRNILGNLTHRMVTETKDVIGALIEEAVDKQNRNKGGQGIERTKALLDSNDKGLIDRAAEDADNVAYASLNDMGNKYNVKNEISRARNSFNNEKLSKIDDFNSNLLDLEDYSSLKRKYSKSLARFLKANGADENIFNATDDASKALLEKGRAYAVDQAKQATFHEYSKLAEALTQFSQKMQDSDTKGRKAIGYVVEGLVPFKKTPINILKQGIKYSPVELVKSIDKMYKAVKGGVDPNEAIESLASGMTGSMIYGLGAFLASQGLLTGGQDDNYTVDNAQTEQGAQNYALKIGDNSYTLDWLAPMALPMFAGVETYNYFDKMKKGDKVDPFDAVIDGLSTIAEPITEMSMLQGINNTLENLSYSGLKSAIGTFGTSALTGYLTQGVPTLAGQIARGIDDTRRSTYTDKDNPVKRQLDKTATKIQNKLPFVSQTNEPYIDSRGQVQQNEGLASYFLGNNFGTRLIDQMASPGYFKHGTVDDVDRELNRLYEIDSENPVYRKVSNGKIGDVRLSKEDFTKYQTLYGQTTDELYQNIIKSDAYQNLDDAQKIKMLQGAQQIAKDLSDSDIGGKALDKTAQSRVDLYKNDGVDAVINYLADDAAAKALDMRHDTYVKKQAEYPGGAAAYAADRDKAKQLGMSASTYTSQQQKNPNGAEGYLADKQAALDYGYVKKDGSANTESYEKARELFGNDDRAIRKNQELKDKGITTANEKLPELINDNTLSNEAKGKLLIGDAKSIKGVKKEMYNMGGYEGAYYYYLIKNAADADGNGSVKKAERTAYFEGESQYLDDLWALNQDMYMYLMQNLK